MLWPMCSNPIVMLYWHTVWSLICSSWTFKVNTLYILSCMSHMGWYAIGENIRSQCKKSYNYIIQMTLYFSCSLSLKPFQINNNFLSKHTSPKPRYSTWNCLLYFIWYRISLWQKDNGYFLDNNRVSAEYSKYVSFNRIRYSYFNRTVLVGFLF